VVSQTGELHITSGLAEVRELVFRLPGLNCKLENENNISPKILISKRGQPITEVQQGYHCLDNQPSARILANPLLYAGQS